MFKKLFNLFKKPEPVSPEYNSEWEKRFNTNPWGTDFICPHCDHRMIDSDALWYKTKRQPREGISFNYRCENCDKPFEVAVSVVVLFKTSYHNYLPTQQKTKLRLIDGGKNV